MTKYKKNERISFLVSERSLGNMWRSVHLWTFCYSAFYLLSGHPVFWTLNPASCWLVLLPSARNKPERSSVKWYFPPRGATMFTCVWVVQWRVSQMDQAGLVQLRLEPSPTFHPSTHFSQQVKRQTWQCHHYFSLRLVFNELLNPLQHLHEDTVRGFHTSHHKNKK